MANLTAKFKLIDEMSAKLDKIAQSGRNALCQWEQAGNAIDGAFDGAVTSTVHAAQSIGDSSDSIEELTEATKRATTAADRLADANEEAEEARIKLWKRKGLLLSDDAVLAAMENTEIPKRMPYSRKRDGSISGDLADRKQFDLLKKYVFSRVGKMVDEIASGTVTPNPYTRGVGHDACAYCPYGAICHKLTVEGRRNYQAISDRQFWEDVQKEVQKHGG